PVVMRQCQVGDKREHERERVAAAVETVASTSVLADRIEDSQRAVERGFDTGDQPVGAVADEKLSGYRAQGVGSIFEVLVFEGGAVAVAVLIVLGNRCGSGIALDRTRYLDDL